VEGTGTPAGEVASFPGPSHGCKTGRRPGEGGYRRRCLYHATGVLMTMA